MSEINDINKTKQKAYPKKVKKFGNKVNALTFANEHEGDFYDLEEYPVEKAKYKCKFIVKHGKRKNTKKHNRRASDLFPEEQDFDYPNDFWQ